MKKLNNIVRLFLLFLILSVFIVFFLQSQFKWVNVTPLQGDIVAKQQDTLSLASWFSGDFQKAEEEYVNENFGFRSLFVRVNNQIAFTCFKKAKANGVVVGKENYLYEENYIDAYYGSDYIGDDSLNRRMGMLQKINDTLRKQNKNLILVFPAGKGSYYPEFIPDKYVRKKTLTNHDAHIAQAKKLGIDFIDFHSWFIENKNKSKYQLYPKYGIHWSYYGICLVADSMVRYIEKKRNIDMPNIYWDNIEMDYPRESDNDIADGMNLKFKLPSENLAYPAVKFQLDKDKTRPSILVIGDSFYLGLYRMGFPSVFSKADFWYYNKQVYPYPKPEGELKNVADLNITQEIAKYDIVMIVSTEATLPKMGWGFIEKAYQAYK